MFVDDPTRFSSSRVWVTVDYVLLKSGRSYRKYFDDSSSALYWCRQNESKIFKASLSICSIFECRVIIDDSDRSPDCHLVLGNLSCDHESSF